VDTTPESLRIAYLRTVVTVEGRPAAEVVRDLGTFWVLTAWNPGSELFSDTENAERHQALCACLDELGHTCLPALGASPDGSWSEESVAVPGIKSRDARALGRQFDQAAVFEVTNGYVRIHGCTDRWMVQRSIRDVDWQPKLLSGRSFRKAVTLGLGLDLLQRQQRLKRPGWVHEGPIPLPCRICHAQLEFFRALHRMRSGTWRELLAVVCIQCEEAWLPDQLRGNHQRAIKAWNLCLLANRDADALKPNQRSECVCYVADLDDPTGKRLARDRRWVYLGEPRKTATERYAEHKSNIRAGRGWVRDFGVGLNRELARGHPPLRTQSAARAYEGFLAARLRVLGYGVKGGH